MREHGRRGRCSFPHLLKFQAGFLFHTSLLSRTNRSYAGFPWIDGEVMRKREEHAGQQTKVLPSHTRLIKYNLMVKGTRMREGNKTLTLVRLRVTFLQISFLIQEAQHGVYMYSCTYHVSQQSRSRKRISSCTLLTVTRRGHLAQMNEIILPTPSSKDSSLALPFVQINLFYVSIANSFGAKDNCNYTFLLMTVLNYNNIPGG